MTTRRVSQDIENDIAELGFFMGRAIDLTTAPEASQRDREFFSDWLAHGFHAQMTYMEQNIEVREHYDRILPDAKSAIIALASYSTGTRVRNKKNEVSKVTGEFLKHVSRYARGRDYHRTLRKKLNTLGELIAKRSHTPLEFRAVVDTVPFFERAHGRIGGLGFIGKNTMLIRPGLGSYFFIGTLFLTTPADNISFALPDRNPLDSLSCGDCRRCLDACPTQAFSNAYTLDASRCLSYLSIEHRDTVDEKWIPHFSRTVYGCDICQEVCPYNFSTTDALKIKELFEPHKPLAQTTVFAIASMSEHDYEPLFSSTAMTRARYSGLVRNALYHLYAIDDPRLSALLEKRKNDSDALIQKTVQQLIKLKTK